MTNQLRCTENCGFGHYGETKQYWAVHEAVGNKYIVLCENAKYEYEESGWRLLPSEKREEILLNALVSISLGLTKLSPEFIAKSALAQYNGHDPPTLSGGADCLS